MQRKEKQKCLTYHFPLQNNHFVSLKLKDSHLWIYSLRQKFTLSELMSILYKVNINTVFTINWLSPGIFNIKKADPLENLKNNPRNEVFLIVLPRFMVFWKALQIWSWLHEYEVNGSLKSWITLHIWVTDHLPLP